MKFLLPSVPEQEFTVHALRIRIALLVASLGSLAALAGTLRQW